MSPGGFDMQANRVATQTNLFDQLAPALKAFYDYTVAAGIVTSVTTFTMSDFNRASIGSRNNGVDHAWGGACACVRRRFATADLGFMS